MMSRWLPPAIPSRCISFSDMPLPASISCRLQAAFGDAVQQILGVGANVAVVEGVRPTELDGGLKTLFHGT